ncbi:phosphodiesterase [Gilvimarinus sp. F26214L]|uniref:phosphodiesterase n=1 Tax=Gilvimarinus sp. DZF01 TaxID=3461371 RepID=UPI0040468607
MKKVIWMTDLHLTAPGALWPANVDPVDRFRRILDEVGARHPDADRLVLTGDLVQSAHPDGYKVLRGLVGDFFTPVRLLAGNHDSPPSLRQVFPESTDNDSFIHSAEDLGGMRLVYLDTRAEGQPQGELCRTRLSWLEAQLDKAGDRPVLLFMHHPPMSIGVPALDRLRLIDSDELARILLTHQPGVHIFCGHVHRNACGNWKGHSFATLKSTHVQFTFDSVAPRLSRSAEPPGYGLILFDSDSVTVNYIDTPFN